MDEADALERLVRRYSPSGHEAPAVREFVRVARQLGYAADTDAVGNGIARRGRGRPRIAFLGHIDTVEGLLPVRRSSGRIHGRGTVDAKGPLAAALLAGAKASGRGEFLVIAAVGEETDSRGARYLVRRLRPDAVIAGEPSGWDGVTIGYKGELQLEQEFRSGRTHYSSPTPTAADRAWEWVRELRELAHRHTTDSPFHSLTVKLVQFETHLRADEEHVRVVVDFRVPLGLSTRTLYEEVPRSLPMTPRIRIQVEPLEVSRTNPVVLSLVEGIRAGGGRPTLWKKAGTSDLNVVVPVWGVPGAAYGPGDAHLDHTDRESVPLAELAQSVGVLRVALERLRSGPVTLRRSAGGA